LATKCTSADEHVFQGTALDQRRSCLVDPDSGAVQKIIALQYNPDTLTRTLQPQSVKDGGDRSEALRLTGRRLRRSSSMQID
jgi:hypothetical protein